MLKGSTPHLIPCKNNKHLDEFHKNSIQRLLNNEILAVGLSAGDNTF